MIDIDPTTLQQLPLEWVVLRLIEFALVRAWKWLRTNPWRLSINKEEAKVEVSFSASTAGVAAAVAKASVAEPEDATKRLPAVPAQEPTAKSVKKAEKKQSGKKTGLRRRPSHD